MTKRTPRPTQLDEQGSKRARTALSVVPSHRRGWAGLPDGPAGLIAERALAGDLADYTRFRAVCTAWRRCAADPRDHSSLDSRFLPRRWIMIEEHGAQPAAPHRRRFLNIATGQYVQMDLRPEIQGHRVFGPTAEGLLVLVDQCTLAVRLLNPFTRQLTEFPSLATLLPSDRPRTHYASDLAYGGDLWVGAAGIAGEGMVALYFSESRSRMLAVAKAGGERWMVVDSRRSWFSSLLSFAGRFYCVSGTGSDVMTVDTSGNQPPRLVVAAQLARQYAGLFSALRLVENGRELMLLNSTPLSSEQYEVKVYRVDLDARKTVPIHGLNGHDVFAGRFRAVKLFASTCADRIRPCLDIPPRLIGYKIEAYHLSNHMFKPKPWMMDPCVKGLGFLAFLDQDE